MSAKSIPQLEETTTMDADTLLPVDSGIQTFKIKAQGLAALFAAFTNVMTAAGDIIYGGASGVATRLANGTLGQVLTSQGGTNAPQWKTPALVPSGAIMPFGGASAPTGFLLCNGAAVSRTTYAALFTAIGSNFGSGDGSTTFNLPDLRYNFLRGLGPNTSVTGSGTISSNNGTFTAHGFTRTGMQARLSSGTLSGLSTSTDYFVIVVDANTLAFATSFANAVAGTKISVTGSNSAVIIQNEDPSNSSRVALMTGGNTGANVGSFELDSMQGHFHGPPSGASGFTTHGTGGNGLAGGSDTSNSPTSTGSPITDATSGTPRTSPETRPKNVYVNYIIAQ